MKLSINMNQRILTFFSFLLFGLFQACGPSNSTDAGKAVQTSTEAKTETTEQKKDGKPIYLDRIKLPEGFKIEVFADELKNARSMTRSPQGTIYVGTRNK